MENFNSIFLPIKSYTSKSDITIGSIETSFTDTSDYSGTTKYNSPKELAASLKNIGISVLNTSNNHSLDYGIQGLTDTKDTLLSNGINSVRN